MNASGIDTTDIDAVICANASADQAMPCNAALLHRELGLARVPAFDVNASCIGFLMGLDLVASLLQSGRYRRVLLTSCDLASRALDPDDLDTFGLFGDGAAAAVLEASDDRDGPALLAARFRLVRSARLRDSRRGSRFARYGTTAIIARSVLPHDGNVCTGRQRSSSTASSANCWTTPASR